VERKWEVGPVVVPGGRDYAVASMRKAEWWKERRWKWKWDVGMWKGEKTEGEKMRRWEVEP